MAQPAGTMRPFSRVPVAPRERSLFRGLVKEYCERRLAEEGAR